MKSGLYDQAGDSATDWAAAWANRLDEAITKVSNVYRGSMSGDSNRSDRAVAAGLLSRQVDGDEAEATSARGWSAFRMFSSTCSWWGATTSSWTARSRPTGPVTVSWLRPRNLDSTRSRISV